MVILMLLGSLWLFWLLYVAIMHLYRAHKAGTLPLPAKLMGYPALAIGIVMDFIFNATVFSLVFLEPPRQILVTHRLSMHIRRGCGWRKVLAQWICSHLLNPFDPDQRGHCR